MEFKLFLILLLISPSFLLAQTETIQVSKVYGIGEYTVSASADDEDEGIRNFAIVYDSINSINSANFNRLPGYSYYFKASNGVVETEESDSISEAIVINPNDTIAKIHELVSLLNIHDAGEGEDPDFFDVLNEFFTNGVPLADNERLIAFNFSDTPPSYDFIVRVTFPSAEAAMLSYETAAYFMTDPIGDDGSTTEGLGGIAVAIGEDSPGFVYYSDGEYRPYLLKTILGAVPYEDDTPDWTAMVGVINIYDKDDYFNNNLNPVKSVTVSYPDNLTFAPTTNGGVEPVDQSWSTSGGSYTIDCYYALFNLKNKFSTPLPSGHYVFEFTTTHNTLQTGFLPYLSFATENDPSSIGMHSVYRSETVLPDFAFPSFLDMHRFAMSLVQVRKNNDDSSLSCDQNNDSQCDIEDLNLLCASGGDVDLMLNHLTLQNPNGKQFIVGDVNLDGTVDSTDLGMILNNFGVYTGLTWGYGDLNCDGGVDSSDLGLLLNNFGFSS